MSEATKQTAEQPRAAQTAEKISHTVAKTAVTGLAALGAFAFAVLRGTASGMKEGLKTANTVLRSKSRE